MSFALNTQLRPRRAVQAAAVESAVLPLVCLHGWGMNLRVFDLLCDTLTEDCDTLAIDLAGHGQSPWAVGHAAFGEQVQDVLAQLPSRCVLLGWSFGAKLALQLAATQPARVAALILISATPRFAQSSDWPHGLDAAAMRAFRAVLEQDWQQTLSDFVWLQLRGSRHAEAAQRVLEAALASQGAPQPEALRNGLALLGDIDLRSLVPSINTPVLLVSGQHDRVTPPGAARWLAEHLPQAQRVEIPRAGHAPFVSHHPEVAQAIRAFLAAHVDAAT